eukprot:14616-Heterococcus_DN1.PRE.3
MLALCVIGQHQCTAVPSLSKKHDYEDGHYCASAFGVCAGSGQLSALAVAQPLQQQAHSPTCNQVSAYNMQRLCTGCKLAMYKYTLTEQLNPQTE